MDYEQKYKDALERASHIKDNNTVATPQEVAEHIFPELAESEDERIRKVIYKLMLGMREEIFTSQDEIVTKEKVLAYLEKHKETITSKTKDYTIANDYTSAYYEERGYKSGYADGVRDTKAAIAKSPIEQKPAEWSEEDERMRDGLITRLTWITYNTRTNDTSPNITFFDEIDWLKSLSPSWKPSEEQMGALAYAIQVLAPRAAKASEELENLREQLKKMI